MTATVFPRGCCTETCSTPPDHVILSEEAPVAISWKASGRGPRLADFAYLIWGTGSWNPRRPDRERIDAAVGAYRQHIEPTDDELGRLEALMHIRTLYLTCFGYRRAILNGSPFDEWWFIQPPEYFRSTAAATVTSHSTFHCHGGADLEPGHRRPAPRRPHPGGGTSRCRDPLHIVSTTLENQNP